VSDPLVVECAARTFYSLGRSIYLYLGLSSSHVHTQARETGGTYGGPLEGNTESSELVVDSITTRCGAQARDTLSSTR